MAQALGGAPSEIRDELKAMKKKLLEQESVVEEGLIERLIVCFDTLQSTLKGYVKPGETSLLEDVANRG